MATSPLAGVTRWTRHRKSWAASSADGCSKATTLQPWGFIEPRTWLIVPSLPPVSIACRQIRSDRRRSTVEQFLEFSQPLPVMLDLLGRLLMAFVMAVLNPGSMSLSFTEVPGRTPEAIDVVHFVPPAKNGVHGDGGGQTHGCSAPTRFPASYNVPHASRRRPPRLSPGRVESSCNLAPALRFIRPQLAIRGFLICSQTGIVSQALTIENSEQALRGGFDTRAIVRRGDRALGHGGDQVRLLPQRLPSPGVRRLAGDGFQRLKLSRQDRDVAFGILPDLVEGFGQQALEARASGDDAQLPLDPGGRESQSPGPQAGRGSPPDSPRTSPRSWCR